MNGTEGLWPWAGLQGLHVNLYHASSTLTVKPFLTPPPCQTTPGQVKARLSPSVFPPSAIHTTSEHSYHGHYLFHVITYFPICLVVLRAGIEGSKCLVNHWCLKNAFLMDDRKNEVKLGLKRQREIFWIVGRNFFTSKDSTVCPQSCTYYKCFLSRQRKLCRSRRQYM